MVKSYLGYEPLGSFGLIVSPQSQAIYDWTGKFCFAGALERIIVWNLRNNSMVSPFSLFSRPSLSPSGR